MVPLPVDDRRQRQRVEVALRGPHCSRVQAERLGAARDPEQARSVDRGVHELADPRERNGPAEVARHLAEAGGAAVHLVELVDVRETTPALPPAAPRPEVPRLELLGGLGSAQARPRPPRPGRGRPRRPRSRPGGSPAKSSGTRATGSESSCTARSSRRRAELRDTRRGARANSPGVSRSSRLGVSASTLAVRGLPSSMESSPKLSPLRRYRCRRGARPGRGTRAGGPPRSRTSARAGRPRRPRSRPPRRPRPARARRRSGQPVDGQRGERRVQPEEGSGSSGSRDSRSNCARTAGCQRVSSRKRPAVEP